MKKRLQLFLRKTNLKESFAPSTIGAVWLHLLDHEAKTCTKKKEEPNNSSLDKTTKTQFALISLWVTLTHHKFSVPRINLIQILFNLHKYLTHSADFIKFLQICDIFPEHQLYCQRSNGLTKFTQSWFNNLRWFPFLKTHENPN